MGLNFKKILQLSGGIAATVATGGAAAPVLVPQVLNLASEFVPEEDPVKIAAEAELDVWEREMIKDWVDMYVTLMDRPMKPKIRARTMEGKLRSDFIMKYADMPDDDWVDAVHEMLSVAVIGAMATGTLG